MRSYPHLSSALRQEQNTKKERTCRQRLGGIPHATLQEIRISTPPLISTLRSFTTKFHSLARQTGGLGTGRVCVRVRVRACVCG